MPYTGRYFIPAGNPQKYRVWVGAMVPGIPDWVSDERVLTVDDYKVITQKSIITYLSYCAINLFSPVIS